MGYRFIYPPFSGGGAGARLLVFLAFLLAPFLAPAVWAAGVPTISGPITGGQKPAFGVPKYIHDYGYVAEEYYLSGSAVTYAPTDPGITALDNTGKWSIRSMHNPTPYKTRLLVIRPKDPAKFNGTVWVEWLNVSATFDLTPALSYGERELLRNGYIYVGVDAQSVGVNAKPFGLKAYAPDRYSKLNVPTDDKFSYGIFAQAGQAIKALAEHPHGVNPFAGYDIEHILASGESQSAGRMVTYIDAVHPIVHDGYEGFFVHSRGAAAKLNNQVTHSNAVKIRSDLSDPVMVVQTETDVVGFEPGVGSVSSRQPDSPIFRLWELAGTSHLDAKAEQDLKNVTARYLPEYPNPICKFPTNNAPERYFIDAAMYSFNRWVAQGIAPPHAPFTEVLNDHYVRDGFGNVIGGLRLPQLQVPVATYTGKGNKPAPEDGATGAFCVLFGTVKPFDQATVNELYPTHGDYVQQIKTSVAALEQKGFLRPYDAKEAIRTAENSDIGGRGSSHGGGCAMVSGQPFDPGFPVLLGLAVLVLVVRYRKAGGR